MQCVFLIPGTILLYLKTTGRILFILSGAVVTPFTLRAGEYNINSHDLLDNFSYNT